MDLFLQPSLSFEKLAMGTAMPEDPNAWPQAIIQELYKQIPFMTDFTPHVEMDKVEGEKGYGFGNITVNHRTEAQLNETPGALASAGIRQVRIPIVVKDGQLSPLDLLVTPDSQVLPLTENRLRSAVFRPQAFDVTSRTPGDQSMIGQLYPPYRQNVGGGGGTAMTVGMGKEGSALEEFLSPDEDGEKSAGLGRSNAAINSAVAQYPQKTWGYSRGELKDMLEMGKTPEDWGPKGTKLPPNKWPQPTIKTGSVLEHIASTMNESDLNAFRSELADPDVRLAYEKNAAATFAAVSTILEAEPDKLASAHTMVRPTVVQLAVDGETYLAKTANHRYWNPVIERLDRGEAIQRFGAEFVKVADMTGAATEAEGADTVTPEPDSDMQSQAPITEFGLYKTTTTDGQELVGYVIPGLIDIDGTQLPLSLFTNGSQAAVQGEILGVPAQGGGADLPSSDAPGGYGAFFLVEGDTVRATVPMELQSSTAMPEQPTTFQGETFDGAAVQVSVQPHIQEIMGTEDGKMLVPESWSWLPLQQSDAIALATSEPEVDKSASARQHFASIEILSDGSTFSMRGPALEKIAETQFLDVDDTMFLLSGLGVDINHGLQKMAEASQGVAPVRVKVGRAIRLAEDMQKSAAEEARGLVEVVGKLRTPLFKEAAVLPDPEAVDTVLSLGFVNPENLTAFISYLPQLNTTQAKLCELLFASRVGLTDVPEGALEASIRSLEQVIEGLKTLAFQGPQSHN